MPKFNTEISKEDLKQSFSMTLTAVCESTSRAQRASLQPIFNKFIEDLDLDLDTSFMLNDRRIGSKTSGRPTEIYAAYWPIQQKVVCATLGKIAEEIGCSVQVLYKHRNKAIKEELPIFHKRVKETHEYVEIHIIANDYTKEMALANIETKRKEMLERTSNLKRHNEDGSY